MNRAILSLVVALIFGGCHSGMKVLTLNTWQEKGPWQERWELILEGLKQYDADVVGFQEVFNMEWAEEVRRRSGYPYLAVSGQHSGLVFLSKFKPLEQECLVMDSRSPNEDYNRYAFYVLVETPWGKLALFNTHFSWQAKDEAVRLSQAAELAAFVKQKSGKNHAIVLGDFNTAPDTVPILLLRDSENWIDTFEAANPGAPGLTWDYRNPYAEKERDKMAERRIDYIFSTWSEKSGGKIKSAKIVFDKPRDGVWPSDHLGVLSEFCGKQ